MTSRNKHIIVGLDSVINSDNIKPGMSSQDLKNLEELMINGGLMHKKAVDPGDTLEQELKEAAKQLGIDYGTQTKSTNSNTYAATPNIDAPKYPVEKYPVQDDVVTSDDEDNIEVSEEETNIFADNNRQTFGKESANDYNSAGKDLRTRTHEQQRRSHINAVMGNMDDNISIEIEKKEDLKYAMLAEIDILLGSLENENVNLSRIPEVDYTSDFSVVDSALRMLRHKNDHVRYCGFANEVILFGAYAMEELFNGERTFFNKYRPNLTGWSNNVNVKLERMRVDTSQIVSNVMHDNNISPLCRILLELIPNCIMHSKSQKQQYNQPSLYSALDVNNSTANMENL